MRAVAGVALLDQAIVKQRIASPIATMELAVFGAGVGILVLVGLWTPIAGALVMVFELHNAFSQSGDPWFDVMLATLAAGLVLLGPGAWSVDARLFGWKRIDIRDRQK